MMPAHCGNGNGNNGDGSRRSNWGRERFGALHAPSCRPACRLFACLPASLPACQPHWHTGRPKSNGPAAAGQLHSCLSLPLACLPLASAQERAPPTRWPNQPLGRRRLSADLHGQRKSAPERERERERERESLLRRSSMQEWRRASLANSADQLARLQSKSGARSPGKLAIALAAPRAIVSPRTLHSAELRTLARSLSRLAQTNECSQIWRRETEWHRLSCLSLSARAAS